MQNMTSKARISSTLNLTMIGAFGVVGGIWLIVSPFLLGYNDTNTDSGSANATTMGVICGLLTILLVGFCLITEKNPEMHNYRFGATIGLILTGVCLLVAPYLFNYASLRNPLYNLQITGAIFVIVAGYIFQELYSHYQEGH